MATKRISWDQEGERLYETGVDRGVLYVVGTDGEYGIGVPWNGLTNVNVSPEGGEPTAVYADNIKYLNLISAEEANGTIEAYTYPDEFEICDGSVELTPGVLVGQQARRPFGLSYRTLMGNDLVATDYGYKIHLVYGATAKPSDQSYDTVNDTPEPVTFSWEYSTTPISIPGMKPTATLTIVSTKVSSEGLTALEDALYGTSEADPYLPTPAEIIALLAG